MWPSRYCKFNSCPNTNLSNKHLFRFPKDKNRCEAWIRASNNSKLLGLTPEKLNAIAVLCEDHFHDWCFMNTTEKKRLVFNAIPAAPKPSLQAATQTSEDIVQPEPGPSGISFCHQYSISTQTSFNSSSMSQDPVSSSKKYTPRKEKLAKSLKRKSDNIRRLKARCHKRLQMSKSLTTRTLKDSLTNHGVSAKISQFIIRQVQLNKSCRRGKRYTDADKISAYQIYCKSKSAYRLLQQLIELPSESTLRSFISSKLSSPGISLSIIDALQEHLSKDDDLEKNFAIIFDEMSIKPFLTYNIKDDNISGFEDFGIFGRSQLIANQVLVVMLKNLKFKKKLPIGFFFSKGAVSASMLKIIVMSTIESLMDIGVTVRAIICDQGTNNSSLFNMLGITPTSPFFTFSNKKIYGIFDPPHLLKGLRRNLMKYDLQTSKGLVSFKHIVDFYEFDKTRLARSAPKLTDKHVYVNGLNSMKVNLAAQIFSNTVSAAMNLCIMAKKISPDAEPTAEFVHTINNLFDSTNGTTLKPLRGKPYHCVVTPQSPHFLFWEEMLTEIDSWHFIHKTNEGQSQAGQRKKRICSPRCKTGWTLTLNALSMLSSDMLKVQNFFIPRRCNQDCLENFFSRIRGTGGNRTNPTAYEFLSSFRLVSVNFCSVPNKFGNCENDVDSFLFHIMKSGTEERSVQNNTYDDDDLHNLEEDEIFSEKTFEALDIIEKNITAYLAGYIARRALICDCALCTRLLTDPEKDMESHAIYLYLKEYDCNSAYGLKYPSEQMLKCMHNLMAVADVHFCNILYKDNVLKKVENVFQNCVQFDFTSHCVLHGELVKKKIVSFSAKLCLKMHLRELNNSLSVNVFNLKKLRQSIKDRGIRSLNIK